MINKNNNSVIEKQEKLFHEWKNLGYTLNDTIPSIIQNTFSSASPVDEKNIEEWKNNVDILINNIVDLRDRTLKLLLEIVNKK